MEHEKHGVTINEALMEIMQIEQSIQITGSVDSELNDLRTIREQIESRIINPAEGLKRARNLVSGRQDYH